MSKRFLPRFALAAFPLKFGTCVKAGLFTGVGCFSYYWNSRVNCQTKLVKPKQPDDTRQNRERKQFTWWYCFKLFLRALWLSFVYIPILLFLPLAYFFPNTIGEALWSYFYYAIYFSGPVFIKFAQWVGTRPDIFSEALVNRFTNFHASAPVHSWRETKRTLEKCWPDWEDHLEFLDIENPLGSGCMTQVYKAKLKKKNETDKIVAVKVMHPNIKSHLEIDIDLIHAVYEICATIPYIKSYLHWAGLSSSVHEFREMMIAQTDLRIEAENIKRFSKNFESSTHVSFPTVYDDFVSEYVLVESFEDGDFISDVYGEPIAERRKLANIGINAFLKMMFDDNFFHSDLHPGNILVKKDEDGQWHLTFIDCGLARSFAAKDLLNFRDCFLAICTSDGGKAGRLIWERSPNSSECKDPEAFCGEIKSLVNSCDVVNLRLSDVGFIMSTLVSICRNHHVQLDGNFASVVVAVMVLEGVGKNLDPDLSILKVLTKILLQKSGEEVRQTISRTLREFVTTSRLDWAPY